MAQLEQSADQENSNSQSSTTTLTFAAPELDDIDLDVEQEQEDIDQENLSIQDGDVTADATSSHVDVDSFEDPSQGGIDAASTAEAEANLVQTADQDNSNSMLASIELTEEVEVEQSQEDIDQENTSEQEGELVVTASSDYVDVDLTGAFSAGDSGIDAEFEAIAAAELEQSAEQSNSNSQVVARPLVPTPLLVNGELEVEQSQEDIDQDNENQQEGVADAYASSEYVTVESAGSLNAGVDGIDADSRAQATADLDQTVDQENENSQTATGTEIEEQEQEEISQENINAEWNEWSGEWEPGQEGYAYATAEAGYVEVTQNGPLSAATGTGIEASSEAVAVAELQQSADQDNSNAQLAILEPGEEVEADQEQDEIDQENVSVQYGEAIADAELGDVSVYQIGGLSSGADGIDAESSALAIAEIDSPDGDGQLADQSNINSQAVTGVPADDVDQEQDVDQSNFSDQEGVAEATAEAGRGVRQDGAGPVGGRCC